MRNVMKYLRKGTNNISLKKDITSDEIDCIMDRAKVELTKGNNLYMCLWEAITTAFYFGYWVGVRASKK